MRLFLALISLLTLGVFFIFGITVFKPRTLPAAAPTAPRNVGAAQNNLPRVVFGTPVRGASPAALTIVEFGDFRCSACALMEPVIKSVLETYRDKVRLAWKDFPNEKAHPGAVNAALAARCAGEQEKFWEFHDLLLSRPDENILADLAAELGLDSSSFSSCLEKQKMIPAIERDLEEALRLAVDAAPYFFIGSRRVSGALAEEQFRALIEAELADKKTTE